MYDRFTSLYIFSVENFEFERMQNGIFVFTFLFNYHILKNIFQTQFLVCAKKWNFIEKYAGFFVKSYT